MWPVHSDQAADDVLAMYQVSKLVNSARKDMEGMPQLVPVQQGLWEQTI